MKIPDKLAVVVVAVGLASCGSDPRVKQQSLCPTDWFCSSDAARAFNCTDMSPDPFQSDLGFCEPPV
jgi:hypothetical protein